MWGFEDETRKQTERAVRSRSGREGRVVCGGGGNISTGGAMMMQRVRGACVDGKVHAWKNKYEVGDGFVNCVLGLDIHILLSSAALLYSFSFYHSSPLWPFFITNTWLHSLCLISVVLNSCGPTFCFTWTGLHLSEAQ